MIDFSQDPKVTAALEGWRKRSPFPTDFGSLDLRGLSSQLRARSVFAARMTNAGAVNGLAETIDDLLAGKYNLATGRLKMMRLLKSLGYDPEVGFPGDMADVPPAELGSLQDLSSERRIDLMLETNMRMATNYGRVLEGNLPFARYAWPAWELVRVYHREVPRGSEESKSDPWSKRWSQAGGVCRFEGALESPMIALKDSPIWQALGDGDGGDYTDTLGNPYPPFAFNSGMGWRAVPRAECLHLGLLVDGESAPMAATLAPTADEHAAALARMPADLRAELERELAAL